MVMIMEVKLVVMFQIMAVFTVVVMVTSNGDDCCSGDDYT